MGRPVRRDQPRPYKAREERRDEIVSATLAILTERGLHAWKTGELARRVGVSESTLFRHFRNKEEILAAAAARATELVRARLLEDRGGATPWERTRILALAVLEVVEETGGAPIIVLVGQLSGVSSSIRRDLQGTLEALHGRFLELVESGRSESGDAGIPPSVLADLAIAIIQSCVLRWVVSGRKFPMRTRADAMLEALHRSVRSEVGERRGADAMRS